MDNIEIFRVGNHSAMNGVSLSFAESDLQATANNYNPKIHEAPLVVGHPKTNSPAYGWVQSLRHENGLLKATPHQVDPTFAEMVRAGRFKKISASFYTPDSPANPAPGFYSLRHVGFLGAQPPAVKGLKDASFSEVEEEYISIEFGEYNMPTDAELREREAVLIRREADLKKAEATNFVERIMAQGRIIPAQKKGLIEFISCLDDLTKVEFSEGSQTSVDWLKAFLQEIPKQVEFGETVIPQEKTLSTTEIASKAQELVQDKKTKGIRMSYTEAVGKIRKDVGEN
jgi:hypothetical protein